MSQNLIFKITKNKIIQKMFDENNQNVINSITLENTKYPNISQTTSYYYNELDKKDLNSSFPSTDRMNYLEKSIDILNNENYELKEKISYQEKREKSKGVYKIVNELNQCKNELIEIKLKLEEKEKEIKAITKTDGNNQNVDDLLNRINNLEENLCSSNSKYFELQENYSKTSKILQEKENLIASLNENLAQSYNLNNEFRENIDNKLLYKKEEYDDVTKNYNEKINYLNEEKEHLNSELIYKDKELKLSHNQISNLQSENNLLFEQINVLKNQLTENQELNTRRDSIDSNFLPENETDDINILYEKKKKQVLSLKKENEKLNLFILNLKQENKIELLKLNTTIEILSNNNNLNDSNKNEENKVNSIIKTIQSKVNEKTIEELKNENYKLLEKLNKLSLKLEEIDENTRKSNPEFEDLIKQENNKINEIREKDKKIEYLLQILEEKNNLLDLQKNESSTKFLNLNNDDELLQQLEFLQMTNENFMKEIDDKNVKIKKMNKEHNDQIAQYEILYSENLTLQETNKKFNLYSNEIELLKNQNKEYELVIEKMNKELNKKTSSLMRKETEVTSLKADRISTMNNKSIADNNRSIIENNNCLEKDKKAEFLNNSLNEIRDFKEKLKKDSINKSNRSKRNLNESLNNNSINTGNNSINFGEQNNPRVLFEDGNLKNDRVEKIKKNNFNDSLNGSQLDNNLSRINFNSENDLVGKILDIDDGFSVNNDNFDLDMNKNGKINNFAFNRQALFVQESGSPIKNRQDEYDSYNISNIKNNAVKETINPNDIIQNQDQWDLLRSWVASSLNKDMYSFKFNKLFKAKNDGFSSKEFYSKTVGKSLTITIVSTNHNKLIGGFTPVAWKNPTNSIDFVEDESNRSFLFSLSRREKYPIKESRIAICHSLNSCPIFGLNDLEIVENSNTNLNYFSNIGQSYDYYGRLEDFYGDSKYYVRDYEVYEVLL